MLKRLAASTMLGLALTAGAVQNAVAQCYDVYEWSYTVITRTAIVDVYEYAGTICFA